MISDPYSMLNCDGPNCQSSQEVHTPENQSDETTVRKAGGDWLLDGHHVFCCKDCQRKFKKGKR